MGSLHWLILIPYYFFATLAVLSLAMLVTRLLRLKLSINSLVGVAVAVALAAVIVPLACDWVDLAAFTALPMLSLAGLSFVLAAADVALAPRLPLPLDSELRDL